ncbi:hypothetical protein DPMN_073592 [Dreissena polymorpha]|uniref:Uncharacterized protein n=1 Tax=Dreissena polymorpha TaxID=45954 RepID=A0A9D4HE83_DREPO|nr:hypothetical protein DPMN_073592 [Dreissena polymorpha]
MKMNTGSNKTTMLQQQLTSKHGSLTDRTDHPRPDNMVAMFCIESQILRKQGLMHVLDMSSQTVGLCSPHRLIKATLSALNGF